MHGSLATQFAGNITTSMSDKLIIYNKNHINIALDVGLHLTRNVRRNIFAVFKGFFLEYASKFTLSLSISKIG
jgi:hypothetical protein